MARAALSLLGFMDETSAVDYLMNGCTVGTQEEALRCWNEAKDRLQGTPAPSGKPGYPEVLEIPEEHAPYLEQVLTYPGFLGLIGGMTGSIKLVEIDPILCYQFHVLDGVGEEHSRAFQGSQSFGDVLRTCLPATREPGDHLITSDSQGYVLTSRDLNFSVVGPAEGHHEGLDAEFRGFAFGLKFPMVSVVRFGDRCILTNGYHRTVKFRKLGLTHIPCLLLEATDYAQTGGQRPGFFSPQLLFGINPPTIGHLAGAGTYPVQVREQMKVVRISVSETLVPLDF